KADAARRAVLRVGAVGRRGAVRDPLPGQPRDAGGDADRRAERGAGARSRRARLSARNRSHRDGRPGRRDRRRRSDPPLLSRILTRWIGRMASFTDLAGETPAVPTWFGPP